jgi:hypothetical protein
MSGARKSKPHLLLKVQDRSEGIHKIEHARNNARGSKKQTPSLLKFKTGAEVYIKSKVHKFNNYKHPQSKLLEPSQNTHTKEAHKADQLFNQNK